MQGGTRVYEVQSRDAPYGEEDARLWDWVAAVIVLIAIVGFAVWAITAWT